MDGGQCGGDGHQICRFGMEVDEQCRFRNDEMASASQWAESGDQSSSRCAETCCVGYLSLVILKSTPSYMLSAVRKKKKKKRQIHPDHIFGCHIVTLCWGSRKNPQAGDFAVQDHAICTKNEHASPSVPVPDPVFSPGPRTPKHLATKAGQLSQSSSARSLTWSFAS